MSLKSGCKGTIVKDVSCKEEKASCAGEGHADASEEEDVEVTKASVTMTTSLPVDVSNRPQWCQNCGEDIGGKDSMVMHLREKHSTTTKCYKCGSCYKSFPSSQQLTQHMLVHTNVRRYQCQYCDKAFKQLSHVQQHERIHTGELPYHCPVPSCDRSFRQLSSMKQHLKGHNQSVTPSNFSAAPLSPSSEAGLPITPPSKVSSEKLTVKDELKDTATTTTITQTTLSTSVKYEVPDSSCTSSSAVVCSSESEDSNESGCIDDSEPVPTKKWHEERNLITPLYQQSLIDLSSKLGEIKRRQRRLRLRTAILP